MKAETSFFFFANLQKVFSLLMSHQSPQLYVSFKLSKQSTILTLTRPFARFYLGTHELSQQVVSKHPSRKQHNVNISMLKQHLHSLSFVKLKILDSLSFVKLLLISSILVFCQQRFLTFQPHHEGNWISFGPLREIPCISVDQKIRGNFFFFLQIFMCFGDYRFKFLVMCISVLNAR